MGIMKFLSEDLPTYMGFRTKGSSKPTKRSTRTEALRALREAQENLAETASSRSQKPEIGTAGAVLLAMANLPAAKAQFGCARVFCPSSSTTEATTSKATNPDTTSTPASTAATTSNTTSTDTTSTTATSSTPASTAATTSSTTSTDTTSTPDTPSTPASTDSTSTTATPSTTASTAATTSNTTSTDSTSTTTSTPDAPPSTSLKHTPEITAPMTNGSTSGKLDSTSQSSSQTRSPTSASPTTTDRVRVSTRTNRPQGTSIGTSTIANGPSPTASGISTSNPTTPAIGTAGTAVLAGSMAGGVGLVVLALFIVLVWRQRRHLAESERLRAQTARSAQPGRGARQERGQRTVASDTHAANSSTALLRANPAYDAHDHIYEIVPDDTLPPDTRAVQGQANPTAEYLEPLQRDPRTAGYQPLNDPRQLYEQLHAAPSTGSTEEAHYDLATTTPDHGDNTKEAHYDLATTTPDHDDDDNTSDYGFGDKDHPYDLATGDVDGVDGYTGRPGEIDNGSGGYLTVLPGAADNMANDLKGPFFKARGSRQVGAGESTPASHTPSLTSTATAPRKPNNKKLNPRTTFDHHREDADTDSVASSHEGSPPTVKASQVGGAFYHKRNRHDRDDHKLTSIVIVP